MEEWKEYKLGDCVEMQKGFAFKSSDYINKGIKIIKVSNLNQNRFDDSSCVFISPISAELYSRYSLFEDDIIISTVGSWPTNPESVVGKVCRVPKIINGSLLNQNAVRLRVKNNFNQRFLYYVLSGSNFSSFIANTAQGSANQASITLEDIRSFKFFSPSKKDQDKIVSILSSLDDKIEVNRRINAELEELAQALFKSWFVNFEPFKDSEFVESELGMIPKGWKVGKLGDIANISSGKRPPMKQSEKTEEINIPLIGAASVMGFTNDVLYNKPILIIGRVGTHGIVQRFNTPCWPSDNTLVIESTNYEYVYQILKTIDYKSLNRGSTQPLITQTDVKNQIILIPNEDVLSDYNEIVSKIMAKSDNNLSEITHLTALRDTLLPKLMSGEIKV